MSGVSVDRITGDPESSHRRPFQRAAALFAGILLAVTVANVAAAGHAGQSMVVTIAATTRECRAVTIDYTVSWRGLPPAFRSGTATASLRTSPGATKLVVTQFDFGRRADRSSGSATATIVRESGFFDSATYPEQSYQVVVHYDSGAPDAFSNTVKIPSCIPMVPATGPASGGTVVTLYGGATFGGQPFTLASSVRIGSSIVSATQVAPDGFWMTFVSPRGVVGTCEYVATDAGLPFQLPSFCYG